MALVIYSKSHFLFVVRNERNCLKIGNKKAFDILAKVC